MGCAGGGSQAERRGSGPASRERARPEVRTERLLRLRDPGLSESSGLTVSARRAGVLWSHDDSGGPAQLFAVDRRGCTIATLTLEGVSNVDWEDLAAAPASDGTPSLWVADTGDNGAVRAGVQVLRVPEPPVPAGRRSGACGTPAALRATPEVRSLTFPDGPRDAEALLVDGRTGRVGLVTKRPPAALYLAPSGGSGVLRRVGPVRLPGASLADRLGPGQLVTGGAVARDGRTVVVRTYSRLFAWHGGLTALTRREPDAEDGVPDLGRQGEAVAFSRDGRALLTSAEGEGAAVWRVPVP